jgi:hypothetical protein
MQKIALVIADTHLDKNLSIFAIEKSLAWNKIGQVYTLSDINFYSNSKHILLNSRSTIDRVDALKILLDSSQENTYLFINWDSFISSPQQWQDEFIQCDFIGTPLWIDENSYFLGSQNFCILSRRLLSNLVSLLEKMDHSTHQKNWSNHDIYMHLNHFLSMDCNFANQSTSQLFSYESGPNIQKTFGISGSANFPLLLNEQELLVNGNEIGTRQTSPTALLNFLRFCLETGKFELFKSSVEGFKNKPNLKKALKYELLINPMSELPKVIQNFNSGNILIS